MINKKTENMLFRLIIIIILIVFMITANWEKLAVDFASGSYFGLLNRTGLITLVATVLGLLLSHRVLAASERRPAHLVLIFLFCSVLCCFILYCRTRRM
jgi:hypothetical protein